MKKNKKKIGNPHQKKKRNKTSLRCSLGTKMYRKARIGYHKRTWVPLRTSNGFTEWSLVCSKPLVQNLYIYIYIYKIKNSTFQVSSLDHPTSRWNKFLTITPNNAKLEPLAGPAQALSHLSNGLRLPKLGRPQNFKNSYYISPLLINSSIKKKFPTHW